MSADALQTALSSGDIAATQEKIRLTTAQAIVRFLGAQYSLRDGRRRRLIPAMLGIFGHGNVAGLGQALDEYQAELPYVQGRNEQSLVHIAAAFAKANLRNRTLAVTSSIGPGATNMVTGAALATINRLPVLLLPGDIYATRRQGPVLQQLEHPGAGDISVNDCFRPVARFFDRITRPEQLLTALPEAMRVLTSPSETGAVVIALPQDIQSEAFDYPASFFTERDWEIRRPAPHPEEVAAVADLLAASERPLIVAGGGVRYSEAEPELAALAEEFGIPVTETFGGKGAVTDDEWWGMGGIGLEGNPAANSLAAEADLVLHVGTRLTDFATASQSIFGNPEVRFASINVVDRDARKQGARAIEADAKLALAALREMARDAGAARRSDWVEQARLAKADWLSDRAQAIGTSGGGTMTQGAVIGILNELAQPGDTIIAASGGPPGDLQKVWDATGGRHCHLEFGYSCMGYEVPATLGVRLAQPEGEVVALVGDGAYLMAPSELATAAQEGLKVTVVISDNHGFQVIRRLQMNVTGHHFGNEMRRRVGGIGEGPLEGEYVKLDLGAVARGLGAQALAAATADELRDALAAARAAEGPVVIVVPTEPHTFLPPSGVWWDVAPAEVSGDESIATKRAAYVEGLANQRWFG
ncbi:MAG TPA: 3D-(3,5/4)-trihydroxycyclohexane-1,2-dione acylhydrolase (decyclizing) [Solirubrobacteraceae bacterium]|nr:3D-(3,5/4)-trihydroxycyclohexane-1,2-dione acylhydrolase (decyclizing) [Solirubrobacteraceae bacterium]